MVDVASKAPTVRTAVAEATVRMNPATLRLATGGRAKKGDVLAAARLAGIQAAKRTPELIPLCHAVALTSVSIDVDVVRRSVLRIVATARATDRTGVEMEALVAASVAALTVYDMLKAVERVITIERVRLLEKSGGRSGRWRRWLTTAGSSSAASRSGRSRGRPPGAGGRPPAGTAPRSGRRGRAGRRSPRAPRSRRADRGSRRPRTGARASESRANPGP
jgi:cyclic pyranopterin phosphate synthase